MDDFNQYLVLVLQVLQNGHTPKPRRALDREASKSRQGRRVSAFKPCAHSRVRTPSDGNGVAFFSDGARKETYVQKKLHKGKTIVYNKENGVQTNSARTASRIQTK